MSTRSFARRRESASFRSPSDETPLPQSAPRCPGAVAAPVLPCSTGATLGTVRPVLARHLCPDSGCVVRERRANVSRPTRVHARVTRRRQILVSGAFLAAVARSCCVPRLAQDVAEHVARRHRTHAEPASMRVQGLSGARLQSLCGVDSPTLGRFDSGAAPLGRCTAATASRGRSPCQRRPRADLRRGRSQSRLYASDIPSTSAAWADVVSVRRCRGHLSARPRSTRDGLPAVAGQLWSGS